MRLIVYDAEVFCEDWLVVFKNTETGKYTIVHNDNEELKQCITEDNIYVGFNSKHYDQFIIKAICCGFVPQEVKAVNDYLIGGGQGWEYPALRDFFFRFNNVDIKDDMQMGLSLKAIEGHLGLSVEESTVPFDIDRALTEDELKETAKYCMHDVDTTERLVELRKDYLKNKVHIGKLAGLDDVKAMGMTNAKLTAALLKATKQPHDDERKYVYPSHLKREYIPQEIFDFFDKMYDPSISDTELFSEKQSFSIGECPGVVGYTKLTSNHSGQRKHIIDTITIHCIVGQWTAKQGCDYFANTDRQCSANYVVGKDGSIGLSVEEKNRSWCSGGTDKYGNPIRVNGISGADNDHRAITIEVASDTTHPYAVTDQAYNALVRLVADICKRNGIKKLLWKGDKSLVGKVSEQNMTVHRWFAQKACPGDYLYNRHAQIAAEVNKLLGNASDTPAPPKPPAQKTLYRVRKSWSDTKSQLGAFSVLANAKSLVDKNPGYKVFDESGKVVYEKGGTSTASVPYIVRVTATDLYIRRGAGTNYGTNGFIKPGVYTIVEEQDGQGATKWGKLKSGAGWISLDFVQKL